MKKLLTAYLLCVLGTFSYAQNETIRSITVTGSAEILIEPDEIQLEIIIREYQDSEKSKKDRKSAQKIGLAKIENELYAILEKNKISKENLTLSNIGFYWYYWWSYRNDYFQQKRFNLRLTEDADFMALVKDLNQPWMQSLRIAKTTSKELQAARKRVKIAAVKAAKEKATYLLESLDESLGQVITIEEIPDQSSHNWYWRSNNNLVSNTLLSDRNRGGGEGNIEHINAIKLRYEIKAVFEIE